MNYMQNNFSFFNFHFPFNFQFENKWQMTNGKWKIRRGFTLVELLVVMAIISILSTLIVGGFRSSQMRGRDAQRKSDLKQIANSLELFYQDYGKYPAASGTQISACPYNSATGAGTTCVWGTGEFRDTDGSMTKTVYFKTFPKDPVSKQNYVYKVATAGNKFQLYARLENTQDKNCINDNCTSPGITEICGGGLVCNFSVTSTNATATEALP
jgi:prepilin-type N-terminal cleavage/methylation domain-containing protein